MTRLAGIFAGGDVVRGPATVIDAIADGHEIARSVRRHLGEQLGLPAGAASALEYALPADAPEPVRRVELAHAPIVSGREFDEVEQRLDPFEAVAEAQRCLRCGPCSECRICARSCSHRHVELRAGTGDGPGLVVRAPISLARALDAERMPATLGGDPLEMGALQRRVEARRCRGCGECVEVCPFDAVHVVPEDGREPAARIDEILCRGCGLCAGVCPTDATLPAAEPALGDSLLQDVRPRYAARNAPAGARVVLACRSATRGLELGGEPVEVLDVPCVGQLSTGALVELVQRGAGRVEVATCAEGACRYGAGAELARRRVHEARGYLALVGADPETVRLRGAAPGPALFVAAGDPAAEGGR